MKKIFFFITVIFFIAAVLRFYHLGDYPIGLHRDEAFLGYNAYSIYKTGRDMNGNFLPLHLQSFLYSPAGYSYITIPFIWFFGLSSFSVRFASAFFGSITAILVFILALELFSTSSKKYTISFLSSLFFAISPWSINVSRTATENTVVVFFLLLGTIFYLFLIKKSKLYILFGAFFCFGLTMFIYQAPRAFLPLFIPLLFMVFHNGKRTKKTFFAIFILFFFIIILPLFFILHSSKLSLRIRTVSIFATEETPLVLHEQISEDGMRHIPFSLTRIFHNKFLGYAGQIWKNYIDHFSYDFLFTDNSLPIRYKVPSMGIVYTFELPLLLLGMWFLLNKNKKTGYFLIIWILLTPLGDSLTFDDVPNLQRTLLMQPAFCMISAYGCILFFNSLRKNRFIFILSIPFTIFVILYSILFYLHQYYVHAVVHRPWYRQEGYKDLVAKVNQALPAYKKAVITDRESAPAVFFLFYGKYDPATFQYETKHSHIHDFDRVWFSHYQFSQEECPLREIRQENGIVITTGENDTIYVNSGVCKPVKNTKILEIIKRSDDTPVFKILTVSLLLA